MSDSVFHSSFAESIYRQRYCKPGEEWALGSGNTPDRIVRAVLGAVGMADSPEADRLIELLVQRKWFPGGRYMANAGTDHPQTQNCLL